MKPDYKKMIIDAIRNKDIEAVERLINTSEVKFLLDQHKILEVAAEWGRVEILKLIVPLVSYGQRLSALGVASSYGQFHCVEFLLSVFDPQYIKENQTAATEAALLATTNNCPRCLELLIPFSNCTTGCHPHPLILAAYYGNTECLKILIPFSEPHNYDTALENAAKNGYSLCVELLIPISNVTAKNSQALWLASKYGNRECVELLAPFGDANAILQSLMDEYPEEPKRWQYLQEAVNQLQRQRIVDEIDTTQNSVRARRI